MNDHYTAYHTFKSNNASPSSLHPLKVLLMNSALSSINMSSKILLLYFGVASKKAQLWKFRIFHLNKVENWIQYNTLIQEADIVPLKIQFWQGE